MDNEIVYCGTVANASPGSIDLARVQRDLVWLFLDGPAASKLLYPRNMYLLGGKLRTGAQWLLNRFPAVDMVVDRLVNNNVQQHQQRMLAVLQNVREMFHDTQAYVHMPRTAGKADQYLNAA